MNLSLSSNEYAQTIADVLVFISFIHNTILFMVHIYYLIQHKNKHGTISKMYWISSLVLFLASFQRLGALSSFSSFGFYHRFTISCKIYYDIISTLYMLLKVFVYLVFIERLFAVFQDSLYAFSNIAIYSARIWLLLYTTIMPFVLFMIGRSYYVEQQNICEACYPYWFVAIVIFLDFSIGIIICVVFTRRLLLLGASCNQKQQRQKDEGQHHNHSSSIDLMKCNVMTFDAFNKFTLLTIIAMFTTLCALILGAIFEVYRLWVSIDTMINSWCIILMFSAHNQIYIHLCKHMEIVTNSECFLTCFGCNCCCCIVITDPFNHFTFKSIPKIDVQKEGNEKQTDIILATIEESKPSNSNIV